MGYVVELANGVGFGILRHSDFAKHYKPSQIKQAKVVFRKTLCNLLNSWLDSGIDENGIESPLDRHLRIGVHGFKGSLYDVLDAWLRRNKPLIDVGPDGKTIVFPSTPLLWKSKEEGQLRYAKLPAYAKEVAIFYFKDLLETSVAHRVARCNKCGCYYVRRRLRKKEIKRGTYCSSCLGTGSIARTQVTRDRRKRERVELAADVWNGFRPTLAHPSKSDWVAWKVNKELRPELRITGKWVSQNRTAIEEEVERSSHAKS